MRIVSYNILDGGEGRADPLAEVVLARKPDVVVIVEADNIDVLNRLAKRFDMDFIHGMAVQHGVAIFSRWRIVDSVNHALLHPTGPRSFLEATISTPAGEVPVCAAHFSARARDEDEQQREGELRVLLDVTKPHRAVNRPHVVAGDFNSNAPAQAIDLKNCKERTREDAEANGGTIPRRVVATILEAGYVDTLAKFDDAAARRAGTFTTQHSGQRVDYVFTFGIETISEAWIETDRLAKYASDHYPVGAELIF